MILLVDDNQPIREALSELLLAEGHEVRCASDGAEALQCLPELRPPSVVLLDLMMPGMNGWEVLLRTSRDPALAKLPIVVITASKQREPPMGARALLPKPIDMKRLLALLDGLLREAPHATEAGDA